MGIHRAGERWLMIGVTGLVIVTAGALGADDEKEARKDPQRIEASVVVDASLSEVWHAWTTNEGVRSFFTGDSNVELSIGGPYEMFFVPDAPKGERGGEGCRVLSYLPEEILSFSWNAPPKFTHARPYYTWVVLRLEERKEGGVRVRLTHLGWREMKAAHPEHADEWDQVREYFAQAWPRVLANLEARFE